MPTVMEFTDEVDFDRDSVYTTGTEATRDLQKHLGLDPCFRTARLLICTTDCQWRRHCRRPVAEWRREW